MEVLAGSGTVSTIAGSGTAGFADGAGAAAQFNYPWGVAVDGEGNVIVADYYNHRVRKISTSGTVSTLAGSGTAGFADGAGAAAQFNGPDEVAMDGESTVIVADYNVLPRLDSNIVGNNSFSANNNSEDNSFLFQNMMTMMMYQSKNEADQREQEHQL